MSAAIRKMAGCTLTRLQSCPPWRWVWRRLLRGVMITEASDADLIYVNSRLNPGFPYTPSPPNPAVTNLVATWHGRMLGFVQLVRHPPSHAPYVGYWLFSLYTLHPRYRGLGIGETLSRALITIARQEGADELFLVVYQTNYPAIRLYQKLGFQQVCLPVLEEQLEEEGRRQGRRRISMVKRLHE